MEKEFAFMIIYNLFFVFVTICIAFKKVRKDNATTYLLSWLEKVVAPILGIVVFGIPLICDLPYVIENNYCYIEGEIVGVSDHDPTVGNHRGVDIQSSETEEILHIDIRNAKLSLGETVKVKYLPNLGIGIVLEDNKWNEEISDQLSEKTVQRVEQLENIALMEALLITLVLAVFTAGRKKKKWLVYPEIGIYKSLMLVISSCAAVIIMLYFGTEETDIKWGECLTVLSVLLFISGMLFQCMGIKKEGSTLVIVPILGKKKEISEDEINKIAFDRGDFIEIVTDGKTLFRITKQFHGCEDLRSILRENKENKGET